MNKPAILDQMSALADGLRGRMLLLLEDHELTVSELGTVLQLPQSTTSRQLKALSEAGWVTSRPDGTRRLYQMNNGTDDAAADARLWRLARESICDTAAADEDRRRLEPVLADRRERSRQFFESEGEQWDRVRDELFGDRFFLFALLGLLERDARYGDLGCGSGVVSDALAPVVSSIVAVDDSPAMLKEARERLADHPHVEVKRGAIEALPIDDDALDIATLTLVLHHVPDPEQALAEVARVLRAGGRLLIVDMHPHDRQEYRQEMGHVWMGFSPERMQRMLSRSGFSNIHMIDLPTEKSAKGPSLFAMVASRDS